VLLKAPGEREPPGFAWAAGPNRWLLQHRRRVLLATGVVMLAGLAVLPSLRIDFDPLKLRNPATESMATLRDLMGDPWATPNTLSVLAPSLEAAQAQAARLKRLPEVREALTVASLIPDDQDTKLAILADLAFLFDPALVVPAGPQEAAAVAAQARALAQRLRALETSSPLTAPRQSGDARPPIASHLANQLDRLAKQLAGPQGAKALVIADQQLAGGAKTLIRRLDTSLSAEPVTLDTLPADLKAGWIATDGRYRVQIYPRAGLDDPDGLATFTRAVTAQAPTAIGPPVLILETGRVVIGAFLQAAGLALVGVVLLLWIAHRNLPDVLRTLAPLLVATVLTLATLALIDLPITFANVIGLPLLLGIGVSYPIYLVALWRSGDDRLLPSAVARAVLFSGFTTMAAFGSLALSDHPGTAGLGVLLALALTYTLLATLVVLPALLGPRDRRP
jgi:hopanoid biosynthesis associated RND transporter like protein HpnN